MRALAVFPGKREIRIVEEPTPHVGARRQVLLRMREVGICGTDREIARFEYGEPPEGADRLVLGHEGLAEVVDTAPEVRRVRPGELVVPTVRRPCPDPECEGCRAGRQDFCVTGRFRERGIKGAHGFLAEYVLEDETNLVVVPRALEATAVLVEPLSIAAKAAAQLAAIELRLPWERSSVRALVLGAGPIGLLGAMVFRAGRVETIVYSRDPAASPRAALARELGATYVSSDEVPLEHVAERCGRVDVLFEAVGVPGVAFAGLRALGPNGVAVLSGVPALDGTGVDAARFMRDLVLKNQLVVGTVNAGRASYEAAVGYLGQFGMLFPDALRALVTRHPLDDAPALLARGRGVKDVIRLAA